MTAYYNEIDPYAAQWLRNLISAGHIASGDVDERSIVDVRADDLRGYSQCHFFAGIGGWSLALRIAGVPDDRPVWTGSCPCQPFSAAGAGKAGDDERHLWPAWFSLIAKCKPAIVFGEQVEAAIGWGWLDLVFSDLEGEGYACGASILPACGVGAPHIRQRLWFVGNAAVDGSGPLDGQSTTSARRQEQAGGSGISGSALADSNGRYASAERLQRGWQHGQRAQDGSAGELANGHGQRLEIVGIEPTWDQCAALERGSEARELGEPNSVLPEQPTGARPRPGEAEGGWTRSQPAGPSNAGFWSCEWLPCSDGKSRPIEPGSFPLAHGIPRRTSKLRAYGNAIVPQVAAQFIRAASEV